MNNPNDEAERLADEHCNKLGFFNRGNVWDAYLEGYRAGMATHNEAVHKGLMEMLSASSAEVEELKGAFGLRQDEYVQQVGAWKIIQRLEEGNARLIKAVTRAVKGFDENISVSPNSYCAQDLRDALRNYSTEESK